MSTPTHVVKKKIADEVSPSSRPLDRTELMRRPGWLRVEQLRSDASEDYISKQREKERLEGLVREDITACLAEAGLPATTERITEFRKKIEAVYLAEQARSSNLSASTFIQFVQCSDEERRQELAENLQTIRPILNMPYEIAVAKAQLEIYHQFILDGNQYESMSFETIKQLYSVTYKQWEDLIKQCSEASSQVARSSRNGSNTLVADRATWRALELQKNIVMARVQALDRLVTAREEQLKKEQEEKLKRDKEVGERACSMAQNMAESAVNATLNQLSPKQLREMSQKPGSPSTPITVKVQLDMGVSKAEFEAARKAQVDLEQRTKQDSEINKKRIEDLRVAHQAEMARQHAVQQKRAEEQARVNATQARVNAEQERKLKAQGDTLSKVQDETKQNSENVQQLAIEVYRQGQTLQSVSTNVEMLNQQLSLLQQDMASRFKKIQEEMVCTKEQGESQFVHPHQRAFFQSLQRTLRATLRAIEVLSTGMIPRLENSTADIAARGIKAISDVVPFGGIVGSIVSGIISTLKDRSERERVRAITARVPFNEENYSKIASELTLPAQEALRTHIKMTEQVNQLAGCAVRLMITEFYKLNSPFNGEAEFRKQMIDIVRVRNNKEFQAEFGSLCFPTSTLQAIRGVLSPSLRPPIPPFFSDVPCTSISVRPVNEAQPQARASAAGAPIVAGFNAAAAAAKKQNETSKRPLPPPPTPPRPAFTPTAAMAMANASGTASVVSVGLGRARAVATVAV